ncbi:MAG: acetyl-CoA carboxylase biotin carboxyl carrier protein [Planctomycetales bacterium]|nr:acetyl-CoA carboxylase biotin carboxyl carrier protein [Planctomycetales bacterium]
MAKAANSASKGDVFDVGRIRDLIDLMEERGLNEVELKQADQQIRLVRSSAGIPAPAVMAIPTTPPVIPANVPTSPAADESHLAIIKAPMVGTFYSKANPKSEDFVKVGSRVGPDTVVCIIEAMKVFNEIPAEISGTIVEILASSEEAVDFGRPLFKVDTRS